ncbi:protein kinase domain-containing protein [Anaerosalibacter sp. Marseille-P3206]|uniref:protein kinase domain-containing protein n=1 Tax=Anaerosalibacter sp. Marseille-P3206 TaxID=1871005 RepID=UPI000985F860|nr:protein kinase [Anaerosalibacter sp. Marseille-P3206]
MELINNRYRIIKNLTQNNIFSTYLVLDMWDENKKMQLNVLNYEFMPSSLIDFYSSEFLSFININSDNIVKNYYFNRISNIDNKEVTEEQYYYTYEYIKKSMELLEYIENMDFFDIIDIFVEICKAINYLHLKGLNYGELNINNILLIKNNGHYKLKLKDLATVKLEKNCYIDDNTDCSYFKSPRILSNENPDKASDIYSLATILLTMLRKKQGNLNPKDDLAIFRKEVQDERTLKVLKRTRGQVHCPLYHYRFFLHS